MFFDLGGNILLKIQNVLQSDLQNCFVRCEDTKHAKLIIDCKLQNKNMVEVCVKEKTYQYSRNNWISQVFQLLPELYKDVLRHFVFLHGSSFRLGNKIVMLLGCSRSGKSTALYNVVSRGGAVYISDDIIAIEPNEKYILPLTNKPIQVREDVVNDSKAFLVNDAWNMNKLAYIQPRKDLKEKDILYMENYEIIYCFIKYSNEVTNRYVPIERYQFINRLFRCCFNLQESSLRLLSLPDIGRSSAMDLCYDGDIAKLLEVFV